jgi:hypothetical protein
VTEGAVGYEGDGECLRGRDEGVSFVDGFKGRVFGLDGVDFGNYVSLLTHRITKHIIGRA